MFGGLAFMVDGNLTVAASRRGGLLVRTDPDDAAEVLATARGRADGTERRRETGLGLRRRRGSRQRGRGRRLGRSGPRLRGDPAAEVGTRSSHLLFISARRCSIDARSGGRGRGEDGGAAAARAQRGGADDRRRRRRRAGAADGGRLRLRRGRPRRDAAGDRRLRDLSAAAPRRGLGAGPDADRARRRSTTGSPGSTAAPTITWSSPSPSPSCWPASAPSSAAATSSARRRWRSANCASIRAPTRSGAGRRRSICPRRSSL